MIRIGIVGDIGSGKSYVAKKFGYPVFHADYEVSKLYKKSRKCYKKLKKVLPKHVTSFPINKSKLSKAILENKKNLKKIINIVHPEVRSKMKKFINKNVNKRFIILDIPLLIENKISRKKDVLVFVEANKKDINKRLKRRINFNQEIVKRFKKLQLPIEKKKKKSNFVVKNNFRNNSIEKSVKIIKEKILLNVRSYT